MCCFSISIALPTENQQVALTYVSALLHALAGLTPSSVTPLPLDSSDDDETAVLVTSQLCVWNVPKNKRKANSPHLPPCSRNMTTRSQLKKILSLENVDPRPPEHRGTAATHLPSLLESISGQAGFMHITTS